MLDQLRFETFKLLGELAHIHSLFFHDAWGAPNVVDRPGTSC